MSGAGSLAGDLRGVRPRVIAVVPAHDEADAIGAVVSGIRAVDGRFDVVVVDDGSNDATAAVAAEHGAAVVRLPFNLGIGAAVQTGFQYALANGYELAVRLDGDGQHDPSQLAALLEPVERGEADIVTGSRFSGVDDAREGYRPRFVRRAGIAWFAQLVSLLTRQRVTDTTSGFQALNRKGIALFANDYPSDYPEVEATLLVLKHRLRLVEVPVFMREREHGTSSITFVRSVYYALKVTLALFVGVFRRYTLPQEEAQ
jgi:glycosyltransferase involved in cell wall biosynthesis